MDKTNEIITFRGDKKLWEVFINTVKIKKEKIGDVIGKLSTTYIKRNRKQLLQAKKETQKKINSLLRKDKKK